MAAERARVAAEEAKKEEEKAVIIVLCCICSPVLNPKSYGGARVLEASGHPMLVIGRSYVVSTQVGGLIGRQDGTTKFAEEIMEYSVDETESGEVTAGKAETLDAGTKLMA